MEKSRPFRSLPATRCWHEKMVWDRANDDDTKDSQKLWYPQSTEVIPTSGRILGTPVWKAYICCLKIWWTTWCTPVHSIPFGSKLVHLIWAKELLELALIFLARCPATFTFVRDRLEKACFEKGSAWETTWLACRFFPKNETTVHVLPEVANQIWSRWQGGYLSSLGQDRRPWLPFRRREDAQLPEADWRIFEGIFRLSSPFTGHVGRTSGRLDLYLYDREHIHIVIVQCGNLLLLLFCPVNMVPNDPISPIPIWICLIE